LDNGRMIIREGYGNAKKGKARGFWDFVCSHHAYLQKRVKETSGWQNRKGGHKRKRIEDEEDNENGVDLLE
jgi:hypothetical protein